MKLLFDQNLNYRLPQLLSDVFPGSSHVRSSGLDRADDLAIHSYAKANNFLIVTKDADFADLALHFGAPPKVIWLRTGNQSTERIEQVLRARANQIHLFNSDADASCFELYLLD